jgi:hypothetical protein
MARLGQLTSCRYYQYVVLLCLKDPGHRDLQALRRVAGYDHPVDPSSLQILSEGVDDCLNDSCDLTSGVVSQRQ